MCVWRCSAERWVQFWPASYSTQCTCLSAFAVLLAFSVFLLLLNSFLFELILAFCCALVSPKAIILFPRTVCRCVEISVWIKIFQNCNHCHLNIYGINTLSFIPVLRYILRIYPYWNKMDVFWWVLSQILKKWISCYCCAVSILYLQLELVSLWFNFYSNLSCYAEYKLCQIVNFVSECLMNIKLYLLYHVNLMD